MLNSWIMTTRTNDDIHSAYSHLGMAGKVLSTRALCLKGSLISLLNQPAIRFYDQRTASNTFYQDRINYSLHHLKDYACFYENTLIPALLSCLPDIDHYFSAQAALCNSLPDNADIHHLLTLLHQTQQTAQACYTKVMTMAKELDHFQAGISEQASQCDSSTLNLNAAMNGDRQLLSSISSQLSSLNTRTNHFESDRVYTGLGSEQVTLTLAVGHIAELFTTSEPTRLVLTGSTLIANGLEAEVTDTVSLASLIQQRRELLSSETTLHKEVILTLAISAGINQINSEARLLLDSLYTMAKAWDDLVFQLEQLKTNLKSRKHTPDSLRQLLLSAEKGDIRHIQKDCRTIHKQVSHMRCIEKPELPTSRILLDNTPQAVVL